MKKTSQYSEEAETRPTDKTSISFQKVYRFTVKLKEWFEAILLKVQTKNIPVCS